MSKKVVILQELLPQYRVPFFEGLRARLAAEGIELVLVHGAAAGARAARRDEASLPWATVVKNRSFTLGGRDLLVWQPALKHLRGADLVVVEHANRLLLNYLLLASRSKRMAYWGHGANLQAEKPDSWSERFKRQSARMPTWWFAYTEGSAQRIAASGFARDRITVVNNAIDTSDFDAVSEDRVPNSTAYVGALDPVKRIDLLLEVGAHLAQEVPGFELIVAGDGPLRSLVESTATQAEWLTYVGPVFGHEKAALLKKAQLLLIPGLVGLVAVDSFAAECPIVTVRSCSHSPEFEYLEHDVNALVLEESSGQALAEEVGGLLTDDWRLDALRTGCSASAGRYTLQGMVAAFAEGVVQSLRAGSGERR